MPQEKYTNIAYLTVTESAQNTLTFAKIETGIAPFEKRAWLISRLEYFASIDATKFAAANDALLFGLTVSNSITDITHGENAVIDFNSIKRLDLGTAASGIWYSQPLVKDLSTLKGGGILVPPNPIYIAAKGESLVGASTVSVRMYYVGIDLKGDEFWELVEMRRMVGT